MSEWKRSTRELPFEQWPLALQAAVQEHIERYNLGDILSDALMYIQTDSEKAKKGWFGGAESVQMSAIVTPRWLVWIVSGTKTSVTALSALLANVVIQDYASTQFAQLVPDSGMEV